MRARRLRSSIGFITLRYWYVRETASPFAFNRHVWFGAIFSDSLATLIDLQETCLFFLRVMFALNLPAIFNYSGKLYKAIEQFNTNNILSTQDRNKTFNIPYHLTVYTSKFRCTAYVICIYENCSFGVVISLRSLKSWNWFRMVVRVVSVRRSMSIAIWEVFRQMSCAAYLYRTGIVVHSKSPLTSHATLRIGICLPASVCVCVCWSCIVYTTRSVQWCLVHRPAECLLALCICVRVLVRTILIHIGIRSTCRTWA